MWEPSRVLLSLDWPLFRSKGPATTSLKGLGPQGNSKPGANGEGTERSREKNIKDARSTPANLQPHELAFAEFLGTSLGLTQDLLMPEVVCTKCQSNWSGMHTNSSSCSDNSKWKKGTRQKRKDRRIVGCSFSDTLAQHTPLLHTSSSVPFLFFLSNPGIRQGRRGRQREVYN